MKSKILSILLIILLLLTSNISFVMAQDQTVSQITQGVDLEASRKQAEEEGQKAFEATTSAIVQTVANDLNDFLTTGFGDNFKSKEADGFGTIKSEFKMRPFSSKSFKSSESINVVLDTANAADSQIEVFNSDGRKINADIVVVSDTDPLVYKIKPPVSFKPGKYRVAVKDKSGATAVQDFNWGVLAINTNKSMYLPGETVNTSIAVLDEAGEMVCNAVVTLKVDGPDGIKTLTTQDETIIVNPECTSKDFTLKADYETSFGVESVGTYSLSLTAITTLGSFSISDSLEVRESLPFEIERVSATRIYPPNTYPMNMSIKANEDFVGTVTEIVPHSFTIEPSDEGQSFESVSEVVGNPAEDDSLEASIYGLAAPFRGRKELNQAFGTQHKDPSLFKKYTDFGVIGHDGVDFDLEEGEEVLATDDGEIVRATTDGDYGTTIVIQHSWGKSYYGHLSKIITNGKQSVKKGDVIGLSGSTGLSSGPHLHFGIKPNINNPVNGYYGKINPIPYMRLSDIKGNLLGVSTNPNTSNSYKVITWKIDVKAGKTVNIGYKFKAPDISPQFYQLGPVEMKNTEGELKFQEARRWQIAADSVVVSGGIAESEVQFGGLQRKLAYLNGAYYAFYSDAGKVYYKKSTDGATGASWGTAVDIDSGDSDNYNPSIAVSNSIIHVFWIDDSLDAVEGRRINTASSDAQGTLCATTDQGTLDTTSFMPTVAQFSDTSVMLAYSDTAGTPDTEDGVFQVTGLDGTCTVNSRALGNMPFETLGSGLTDGDRPVVFNISSTSVGLVYQDGDLSYSVYNGTLFQWTQQNQQIANVADNIYSVVNTGSNIFILTVDTTGTDEARLYKCCTASTGIVAGGTSYGDLGAADADTEQNAMDMYCISATDCKFVWIDNNDTTSPDLMFRDCDDATCSTGTTFNIDSDTGDATTSGNPAIWCVATDNCKIVYGDMAVAAPDFVFVDCTVSDCDNAGTSGTCATGGRTCTIVDTDLGAADTMFYADIYCISDTDCKVSFFNSADETNDVLYMRDCDNATCSTGTTTSVQADMNADLTYANAFNSIWCPSATDCKIVFHDAVNGDLTFIDCSNATCSTQDTGSPFDIDIDVGLTNSSIPNDITCPTSTNCKIIYSDASQGETNFVDCDDATPGGVECDTVTITTIDELSGNNGSGSGVGNESLSIYCVSSTDCKGIFGDLTDTYFFDCDNETCTDGSVIEPFTGANGYGGAVDCVGGTDDCKMIFSQQYSAGVVDNPAVLFYDATTGDGIPAWSTETGPWTGQTNLTSATLMYETDATDLVASVIKDSSEQAYYKTSDVATISWSGETSWAFTAGDLGHISSEYSGLYAAVVLRQGTNFEFAGTAPAGPTMDQVMRHGNWFSGGAEAAFTF